MVLVAKSPLFRLTVVVAKLYYTDIGRSTFTYVINNAIHDFFVCEGVK